MENREHFVGRWIGADLEDRSAPLLRRAFAVHQPVASARLYLCGLGYHEAWLNGARVGDHVLDPAQTDYEQRVLYVVHDVTGLVRPGANALGVMLGNGWFNQDRVWSPTGLSYGPPRLMAELRLTFADGSTAVIPSDERWRCAPGPVTDNNLYAGESYDARREIAGWCRPEFDDAGWRPVALRPAPGGALQEQLLPPIRRVETLRPVAIQAVGQGRFVVDLGQNFAGWARLRVAAPAGTAIQLRFAETVFPDGQVDTASTGVFATGVEQVDRYICRGGGTETWEPRFTYHGFRYVEVTGWPGALRPGDIEGVVVHTDLPVAGSFECSDPRLNQLHRLAVWTHRSNIHGIPEDCPARERCGWLGDANLVAEYSLWNYDAKTFWEKYLDDIETTRARNGGIPADVAPGKRCTHGPAHPDWAAAFILLPWYVYLHSGDPAVLVQHWAGMSQLMQHFQKTARGWILPGGYGDFFDPGADSIVTHTPPTLSTTLWFYRCAEVMAASATVLGEAAPAAQYRQWRAAIATAVAGRYFDPVTGSFGSQGANALALAFGVLPAEEERILAALVRDIRERETHLNCGVMGVRYLFEELIRRGQGPLALELLHQDSYPSFGHLIGRGATTLWEGWGEKGHDEKHGARSLNHPFMGGYDNLFFTTLAGIQIDSQSPGFRHFYLHPHPVPGLEWVRCHHDCVHGRIRSDWRVAGNVFHWHVAVPAGTTATAILPWTGERRELAAGDHELEQ